MDEDEFDGRLRRRRTAKLVAGSALAVVAIVGGVGIAHQVGRTKTAPPTTHRPSPTPCQVTEACDEAGLSDANLLSTADLKTAFAGVASWRDSDGQAPAWTEAADEMGCGSSYSDWTPDTVIRVWQAGDGNRAQTTVMRFPDRAAADTAYRKLGKTTGGCFVPSGRGDERAAGPRLDLALDDGGRSTWRSYLAPEPDICIDCDQGWLFTRAFVQRDRTLVVISTAHLGDLNIAETDAPWLPELVERASVAAGRS